MSGERLEVVKEEIIDEFKVVMRRNESLKYIEVGDHKIGDKGADHGLRNCQYLPTWSNEHCDGPAMAEEYFQALVAWIKDGRKGRILPFSYGA